MNINIHIEQLLLDGIDATPQQLAVLKASFESQLANLMARDGMESQFKKDGAMGMIQTESIGPVRNSNPTRLGERIACAVYGGLR